MKDDFPYNAYEVYFEMRDECTRDTLADILAGVECQPWRLVPFGLAKRIWTEYARLGSVRNEKGLEKIRSIIMENIIKLDVNTELCGHSVGMPWDEIDDAGVSKEMLEETTYFGVGGNWRVSDFAIKPLEVEAIALLRATSPKDTIDIIDRVLAISHLRSDLASWFIEGGTAGLDELGGFNATKT